VLAFSKGVAEMANEVIHPEADESLYLAESVGLLWEATRRVITESDIRATVQAGNPWKNS
jgi:hypothetical protein